MFPYNTDVHHKVVITFFFMLLCRFFETVTNVMNCRKVFRLIEVTKRNEE